ncbi:MAG: nicotinamide riboside transporter PnuC [Bacteroidales bacterium]|nr:nicotinamide riboside transporter PnuC [Bacteroidales bacterium]
MDWLQILQIFTLVTGVIYMIMQIVQHKLMWYFNIMTASGALVAAMTLRVDGVWSPLWAQVALNSYFLTMSFVGIVQWKKLKGARDEKLTTVRLGKGILLAGIAIVLIGAPVIWKLLTFTSDRYPLMDAISLSFSAVAAWWLTRKHAEEWYCWIIADILVVIMYAMAASWWMMLLYVAYTVSSVAGLIHWKKKGVVIDVPGPGSRNVRD